MNVNEAIEVLKDIDEHMFSESGYSEILVQDELYEAAKVAVATLSKEIPKKMFNEIDFGKTCSVCRSTYEGGLYCRTCGNRLEVTP